MSQIKMPQNFFKYNLLHLIISGLLLTVFSGGEGVAQTPHPQNMPKALGLEEAVKKGVFSNPEFLETLQNLRAAEQRISQARAGYLPSVDLSGDIGREYTKNSVTEGPPGGDSETFTRKRLNIQVNQLIFDGFQTPLEVRRQKKSAEAAGYSLYETGEQKALDIIESYIEVQRQRRRSAIARDNIAKHTEILTSVRESTRAGRTSRVDVDQVLSRLAQARADLAGIQESLDSAMASFERETGLKPRRLLGLDDNKYANLVSDLTTAVDRAHLSSPAILEASAETERAQADYKQTAAPFYPSLNLELSGQESEDISGIQGLDRSGIIQTTVNWNLYSGGEDTARRREFSHRLASARALQARVSREVESQIRTQWAAMKAARERQKNFAQQAKANEALVSAYYQQFNLGRRKLIDVLDVQAELFSSRSNIIESRSDEFIAIFTLKALQGRLLESLNIENREILP